MAFGIDFGTTNSAVTYESNVRLDVGQDMPFPSVVAIHKQAGADSVICGPEAREHWEALATQGYRVFTSVKRHLGTDSHWNLGGDRWTPQRVATQLFAAMKKHAEESLPHHGVSDVSLEEAVVAIPARFPSRKRIELRRAAREAGIRISSFIAEPTAAFLHCSKAMPPCDRVAVFDWGGCPSFGSGMVRLRSWPPGPRRKRVTILTRRSPSGHTERRLVMTALNSMKSLRRCEIT